MSPALAGTKADFVDELRGFYEKAVHNPEGIADMYYVVDVGNNYTEWVYVVFGSGSQKRFNVSGDNNHGILLDFTRFLDHMRDYPWLHEEDKR